MQIILVYLLKIIVMMTIPARRIKGRGAQMRIANRFSSLVKTRDVEDFEEKELTRSPKTEFIDIFPKTIVNKVVSKDLKFDYSLNPYQGCEHGCVYCYARNSHEYWGYGPGLDFEHKILVKKNAPQLLEELLQKPSWKAAPIMLSGNTDCYQPIERKLGITRELLKVFLKYKHPVAIITKNALIKRDLDIIEQLAKLNLVHVTFSITSLDENVRSFLEPRTSTAAKKLEVMKQMNALNIPVQVMMGPIIPGLNNHEIFKLANEASKSGARNLTYTVVRLNGSVAELFEDFLRKHFPLKADHVLSLIRQCHGGKLSNSRAGVRIKGEGEIARMIGRQITLAREKYMRGRYMPKFNFDLHERHKGHQMFLF